MSETMLKKHQCIPFIATAGTGSGAEKTYTWKRVDKSTIFSLNPNPQTETMDWISTELPEEVIDHYEPELPQEIATYEGNPVYDFMFEKFYTLPVASDANVPRLICFPGSDKKAWLIDACTVQLGEFNTVDKKISFTLKFGGDIARGTYAIANGVPTFTAGT